jgi:hypothetical protein
LAEKKTEKKEITSSSIKMKRTFSASHQRLLTTTYILLLNATKPKQLRRKDKWVRTKSFPFGRRTPTGNRLRFEM